jgi:hypothetical protein
MKVFITKYFAYIARQIKPAHIQIRFLLTLLLSAIFLPQPAPAQYQLFLPLILKDSNSVNPAPGPTIGSITTNLADYPDGRVPRYEKFELTFEVNTVAENLQLPYDPAPPPGLKPGIGITVNALFSPDGWQTVYTQPAFYYQDYQHEIKEGKEWLYPTNNFTWKVRFAPNQVGNWQYKLVAQDANGRRETSPQIFTVTLSDNKGFVRVSQADTRYFEYDNGAYFPGLGYNMNVDHVGWTNPKLDNEENFQIMSQNGIQLIRIWLSQWAIYGSEWNPWVPQNPELHNRYYTYTGITFEDAVPESEVSMKIEWDYNPCMVFGLLKPKPAVKRNTDYRIRIRYKTTELTEPRISGYPHGFVAKTGGWLWGQNNYCYDPGVGTRVTPYQDKNTTGWEILEGRINTGDNDFLPNFFLVLENVKAGTVYVDYVWVEEDLGLGQYGPNIISKPWMAHHLYIEQRDSYAFDKVLELAKQYGIYLRPVIHEKNERIFNRINYEGNPIPSDSRCWDGEPANDPQECPGNRWFYGNRREMTEVRWLQRAWWRYLQARWGYATNIHSWELLNEGDPTSELHYTLADEFGKYMHQFKPNDHLVSTSNWVYFPGDRFWANPEYPHVDFADYHRYIKEDDPLFIDTAQATYETSMQIGAGQPDGLDKPLIRGETGFVASDGGRPTDQFQDDTNGIWLHNFIWGNINAGGMIESYFYENIHIYSKNKKSDTYNFDHRDQYGAYYNFVSDIPLNNGYYQDAQASVSRDSLRAWGQKDLVHGCAHLWLQNKNHTWKNVVDDVPIPAISGSVEISGFQPDESYTITWWDPYQANKLQQIIGSDTVVAQADGSISIRVTNLATDVALKIIASSGCT